MRGWVILAGFLLASCAGRGQTETVYLAREVMAGGNLVQKDAVQCGPYSYLYISDQDTEAANTHLRQCVSDYQRTGYGRVPGPPPK